ncbi:hypothetical protein RCL1_000972 [Eukaryota sp. TZLM3-RCL]
MKKGSIVLEPSALDALIAQKEASLRESQERLATGLQNFFQKVEQGLSSLENARVNSGKFLAAARSISHNSEQVRQLLDGNDDWFSLVSKVARARHNMRLTLNDVDSFGRLQQEVASACSDFHNIIYSPSPIYDDSLDLINLHTRLVDMESRRTVFISGIPEPNRIYVMDSLKQIDDLRAALTRALDAVAGSLIEKSRDFPELVEQVFSILEAENEKENSEAYTRFQSKLKSSFENKCQSILNIEVANSTSSQVVTFSSLLAASESLESDIGNIQDYVLPLIPNPDSIQDPLLLFVETMHAFLAIELGKLAELTTEIPRDDMLITVKWLGSYHANISRLGFSLDSFNPKLFNQIEPAVQKYVDQLKITLDEWMCGICREDRKALISERSIDFSRTFARRKTIPTTPACTDVLRAIVQTLSLHFRQDRGEFFQRVLNLCCLMVSRYASLVSNWISLEYNQVSLQGLCALSNNFTEIIENLSREIDTLVDAAPRVSITSWDQSMDKLLYTNAFVLRFVAIRAAQISSKDVSELFSLFSEPDAPVLRDFASNLRVLLSPLTKYLDKRALARVAQDFFQFFGGVYADGILSFKVPVAGSVLGKLTEDVSFIESSLQDVFRTVVTTNLAKQLIEPLRNILSILALSLDDEDLKSQQAVQSTVDLFDSYFRRMANIWTTATENVAEKLLTLNPHLRASSTVRNLVHKSIRNSLTSGRVKPRARAVGLPFLKICGLPEDKDLNNIFIGFVPESVVLSSSSAPPPSKKEPVPGHRRAQTLELPSALPLPSKKQQQPIATPPPSHRRAQTMEISACQLDEFLS